MSCWQGKRKGFFLIFSLWVIVLLSLFCLGLGFRTYIETQKTKLSLAHLRSYHSAVSGIYAACAVLEDDNIAADYLNENWARPFQQDLFFSQPKAKGFFRVTISDESARFNINKASRNILEKIFSDKQIRDAEKVLDSILYYAGKISEPPYMALEAKAKRGELVSYDELLLIEGLEPQAYHDLKDAITVFGDGRININTASEELLTAVVEDDDVREKIFKMRFGAGKGYFENYAELPQEVEPFGKVSSDIFRIVSIGEVGSCRYEIACVFDRKTKDFLYWYEK